MVVKNKAMCGLNDFSDLLIFLDENDNRKKIYCKIIKISFLVKYKTDSGNIISIPYNKVIKIKQRIKEGDELNG